MLILASLIFFLVVVGIDLNFFVDNFINLLDCDRRFKGDNIFFTFFNKNKTILLIVFIYF